MSGALSAMLKTAGGALALLGVIGAHDAAAAASNVDRCVSVAAEFNLGTPPARTRARLRAGQPVTIVALGSSSTSGFGTFGPGYPEVLQAELSRRHPESKITVINRGRVGDTLGGMLARLDRDVLRARPHLVVWQLGTNSVVWHGIAADARQSLRDGVRRLKNAKADVILMDLQYAPLVTVRSSHRTMEAIIARVAHDEGVGLFPRFALMRRAIAKGIGGLVFLDGLHNSGDGYRCIGRALARMIDGDMVDAGAAR